MGIFDFSQDPADPGAQSLASVLAALSQASMPSRLPISNGGVLAGMGAAALQGRQNALDYQAKQQALQSGALDLALKKATLGPFVNQLQDAQQGGGPGAQPQSAPPVPGPTSEGPQASPPAGKTPFDDYYDSFLAKEEGGYTPSDGNGQPANFGINQGANPDVDVKNLTPEKAKQLAYDRYWTPSGANHMNPALAAVQADTAFNMGPTAAWQLLQQSGGDPNKYLALRAQRYQQIAQADPSKQGNLQGWLKRNQDLAQYVAGFTQHPDNPQPAPAGGQSPSGAQSPAGAGQPGAGNPTGMTGLGASLGMRMLFGGKDRYQTMRNGWAYDTWTNSWQHFPDLGEGVTGEMGPDGQLQAKNVPGQLDAMGKVEGTKEGAKEAAEFPFTVAKAGVEAGYKPVTIYDGAGNEYTVPSTWLQGGQSPAPQGFSYSKPGQPAPAPAAGPQPAAGAGAAPVNASAASAAAAPKSAPGTPNTPVQNSASGIPTKLDDFLGQLGPGYSPPQRGPGIPGALMGAPNQGQEEVQKDDAERLEGYAKEASAGQKVYTNLQQLYQIMQRGLNTGKITESATGLTNLARQFGMDNLIPKDFDPNDAAAFNKLATDLVFAQLKQLPGQPRVSEIEGLKQANPNLAMTPAANTEILNNILAEQRWKDARADLGKQYMMRYGSLGDFDARFNEKYPELDLFNTVSDAAKKAGWKLPGSPGTPSGGQYPAPPPKKQRGLNQVYQTPRGPMKWVGNGWLPAQ